MTLFCGITTLPATMIARRLLLTFVVLLATVSPCRLSAQDAPIDGVLALSNGRVLRGQINSVGDNYIVTIGQGGRVTIPIDRVEFVCETLDEVYRLKRSTLERGRIRSHLTLAEWCMNHQLLARAADQLLVASLIDPEEPLLRALEKRLDLHARRAAVADDPEPLAEPIRAAAVTRHSHTAVAVDDVSPQAMEQFTSSVQPVLMNRCAANGCHGWAGESQFRLVQSRTGRAILARSTRTNLEAALRWVDADRPAFSPLLLLAQQAHGDSAAPPLDTRSKASLEILREWVMRVARPASRRPATVSQGRAVLSQPNGQPSFPDVPTSPQVSGRSPNRPDRGFSPRDDFDPEIFNRQEDRR